MKRYRIHELIEETKVKERLNQGRKVTQADLAQAAGVHQASISAIASGKTLRPSDEVLQAIADVFSNALRRKVSIDDLRIQKSTEPLQTVPAHTGELDSNLATDVGLAPVHLNATSILSAPHKRKNIVNALQDLITVIESIKEEDSAPVPGETEFAVVASHPAPNSIKEHFKRHDITLNLTRVSRALESDDGQISLYFYREDLNGLQIEIFIASDDNGREQQGESLIRTINNSRVNFHLSHDLGIELSDIAKVWFVLKIGEIEVKGRLYGRELQ